MEAAEYERIAERRRQRRAQERELRQRLRRRNLVIAGAVLAAIALIAFVGLPDLPSFGGDDGADRAQTPIADAAEASPAAAALAPSLGTNVGLAEGSPVPILMYHVISDPPADAALPELFVNPDDFAKQMAYLGEQGFTAITLDQLFAAWNEGGPAPPLPIVVSFDDGYLSQYTDAFPTLKELSWPGVLNLKVDSLDQGELSEGQVKEMIAAGWEIDAHTIHHLDITTLDDADLKHEVAGSRRILQSRLDVPVNFFCYPAGAYDERSIAAVKKAGYEGATTTNPGLATPDLPYELARVRIDGSDGVAGFEAKLTSALEGAG